MAFSAFKRRMLVGWLRDCEEGGRPSPGDRAIATRLDFGSVSLAGDILAELEVEGIISVTGSGADRVIRVLVPRGFAVPSAGTQQPPAAVVSSPQPEPMVTTAEAEPMLQAEPQRVETPQPSPIPDRPVPPDSAFAPGSGDERAPMPVEDAIELGIASPAAPASDIVQALEVVRDRHPHIARAIERHAEAHVTFLPGRKPRITADIIRAANDEGIELYAFCSDLLRRGFLDWQLQREAAAE